VKTKWIFLAIFLCSTIHAQCPIYYKNTPLEKTKQDAVNLLLNQAKNCPKSIAEFNQLLQVNNLAVKTTMVANRGKNNPSLGSFSFFASIAGAMQSGFIIQPGEFYLGYFTGLEGDKLQLDQQPETGKLLIELIAWDQEAQWYDFYELRGLNNAETRWFYRGNSGDALLDNQYLYRDNPKDKPKFGKRMRCSACHNSGGPIMKEIKLPHNDWWDNASQLPFLPNHPDETVELLVNSLVDAPVFAAEVETGIKRTFQSEGLKQLRQKLSLQERLRPLFCTTEINIESAQGNWSIPSAFWLNPLLGHLNVELSKTSYQDLLEKYNMHFPETDFRDADHAWLTPVKGRNDLLAIKQLVKEKTITLEFAQSVLMIDFAHPVFSSERCGLLQFIPAQDDANWLEQFSVNLKGAQENGRALELAGYLANDKVFNQQLFHALLVSYFEEVKQNIETVAGQQVIFGDLLRLRKAVGENELSQNPLGQILEPGFRVIFPVGLFLSHDPAAR